MIESVKNGERVTDAVGCPILGHAHADQTVERVGANPHVIGAGKIIGWSISSAALAISDGHQSASDVGPLAPTDGQVLFKDECKYRPDHFELVCGKEYVVLGSRMENF